ncbi:MAG: hypothetical protein R3B84_22960 [Zavarzinella sp.]
MNRSWRTALNVTRTGAINKRPDIIGVRRDGKVDAFEVLSITDDPLETKIKLRNGMDSLPEEHQGKPKIIRDLVIKRKRR